MVDVRLVGDELRLEQAAAAQKSQLIIFSTVYKYTSKT